MCYCTSSLRTPCCGTIGCHPPEGGTISDETILKNSQVPLWQSYIDKKQECEVLREMLEDCMRQCEYLLKTDPEVVWGSKVSDKLVVYKIYLQTGEKVHL